MDAKKGLDQKAGPKAFDLKTHLKNGIRNLSYRCPMRTELLKKVRVPTPPDFPNQRLKHVVPCAHCKQLFAQNEIQVDHIFSVVPTTGWPDAPKSDLYVLPDGAKDMNVLVYRTFVSPDQLQALCLVCHKAKSKEENARRRANKC